MDGSFLTPFGERNRPLTTNLNYWPPIGFTRCAFCCSNPSASDIIRGSLAAASSRVDACISKYRAFVTVEGKIRESDELRHHALCISNGGDEGGYGMYEEIVLAAYRPCSRFLSMPDDEAKVRWRCCAVLRAVVPAAAKPHTDMYNTNAEFQGTVKEKQLSFHSALPTI